MMHRSASEGGRRVSECGCTLWCCALQPSCRVSLQSLRQVQRCGYRVSGLSCLLHLIRLLRAVCTSQPAIVGCSEAVLLHTKWGKSLFRGSGTMGSWCSSSCLLIFLQTSETFCLKYPFQAVNKCLSGSFKPSYFCL